MKNLWSSHNHTRSRNFSVKIFWYTKRHTRYLIFPQNLFGSFFFFVRDWLNSTTKLGDQCRTRSNHIFLVGIHQILWILAFLNYRASRLEKTVVFCTLGGNRPNLGSGHPAKTLIPRRGLWSLHKQINDRGAGRRLALASRQARISLDRVSAARKRSHTLRLAWRHPAPRRPIRRCTWRGQVSQEGLSACAGACARGKTAPSWRLLAWKFMRPACYINPRSRSPRHAAPPQSQAQTQALLRSLVESLQPAGQQVTSNRCREYLLDMPLHSGDVMEMLSESLMSNQQSAVGLMDEVSFPRSESAQIKEDRYSISRSDSVRRESVMSPTRVHEPRSSKWSQLRAVWCDICNRAV